MLVNGTSESVINQSIDAGNRAALNQTVQNRSTGNKSFMNKSLNDSKFVSQFMTLNGTRVGQEQRKQKTKKRIIPIAEKSKVISKGSNIADKLDFRRNSKILGKTISGACLNRLG